MRPYLIINRLNTEAAMCPTLAASFYFVTCLKSIQLLSFLAEIRIAQVRRRHPFFSVSQRADDDD